MKKFRIYFHKNFYHQPELPFKTSLFKKIRLKLVRIFEILVFGIIGLCYLTGHWLLLVIHKIYKMLCFEFLNTSKHLKMRSRLFFSRNFLTNSFGLILSSIFLVLLLTGFKIFATGIVLKENVLGLFGQGQKDLTEAKNFLSSGDPNNAFSNFAKAYKSFSLAQKQISDSGAELKLLISLLPEGSDGKKIIDSSSELSQAGASSLNFYNALKRLKFTAEGISSSEENKTIILESASHLNLASQNLKIASNLIGSVSLDSVPKDNRSQFLEISGQIKKSAETFSALNEIYGLFAQSLLKAPDILLVMQNNNELRPGGGFIGSFAALKQSNGKISKTRMGSIYDLDGQLSEKVVPPLPLLAVNDRWYLRDSNWFAHFPFSAKKITEFYEKEGGETPDIIVALTPNIIVDLLKLTGEVNMPKYGVVLTSENFVEQTQVLTTMSNDTPENQPKQFLADLMPVLLQRLGSLNIEKLDGLLSIVFNNLMSKQLIFYSRHPSLQTEFSKFNWTGEILDSDRDYLEVVSSNLGGTKSDLFVDQTLKLSSKIDSDGSISNELIMTFENRLPDLEHTHNTRFIRVLVPKNSKLISVTGFDYKNIEPLDSKNFKFDPDGLAWDSRLVKDVITGTLIGEESGKTFFGNWLTVKGGQKRSVKIVYKLPFALQNLDRFSLLLQKQPGANTFKVEYNLNFDNFGILWKSFDQNFDAFGKTTINSDLNQDRFWGMVVKK